MQTELEKYGINMPSFGKIGGILANEVRSCNTTPDNIQTVLYVFVDVSR